MSRQDDRIDRERAAQVEADRIITDAINAAWNRIASRPVAPLTCDDALSTPVPGRPTVQPDVPPESP